MTDVAEYLIRFFAELERLVPDHGTRHMISTTEDGWLEIRIGAGDWYRISKGAIHQANRLGLPDVWPRRHRIEKTTWGGDKEVKINDHRRLANLVGRFDVQ